MIPISKWSQFIEVLDIWPLKPHCSLVQCQTIPYLHCNDDVGYVQTRWIFCNSGESYLTKVGISPAVHLKSIRMKILKVYWMWFSKMIQTYLALCSDTYQYCGKSWISMIDYFVCLCTGKNESTHRHLWKPAEHDWYWDTLLPKFTSLGCFKFIFLYLHIDEGFVWITQ